MKRELRSLAYVLVLGTSLTALSWGGAGGCSSDGADAATGADDDTVTATAEDANAAYSAASDAITSALTTSTGSALTLQGGLKLAQAVDTVKNTISVASASSCSEGDVPSPTENSETVAGSDIFSGGSGSCTVSWDEGDDLFDILLDCDSLSDGSDTIDGRLGFTATVSGSDFGLDVGSQDLTFTFDGESCSLVANISIDVTFDGASSTISADGCLGLCGEFFSISGEETF